MEPLRSESWLNSLQAIRTSLSAIWLGKRLFFSHITPCITFCHTKMYPHSPLISAGFWSQVLAKHVFRLCYCYRLTFAHRLSKQSSDDRYIADTQTPRENCVNIWQYHKALVEVRGTDWYTRILIDMVRTHLFMLHINQPAYFMERNMKCIYISRTTQRKNTGQVPACSQGPMFYWC